MSVMKIIALKIIDMCTLVHNIAVHKHNSGNDDKKKIVFDGKVFDFIDGVISFPVTPSPLTWDALCVCDYPCVIRRILFWYIYR